MAGDAAGGIAHVPQQERPHEEVTTAKIQAGTVTGGSLEKYRLDTTLALLGLANSSERRSAFLRSDNVSLKQKCSKQDSVKPRSLFY